MTELPTRTVNPAQHLACLQVRPYEDHQSTPLGVEIFCASPTCDKVIYSVNGPVPITEINSAATHHVNRGVELS